MAGGNLTMVAVPYRVYLETHSSLVVNTASAHAPGSSGVWRG
jgi:hypothetical protein